MIFEILVTIVGILALPAWFIGKDIAETEISMKAEEHRARAETMAMPLCTPSRDALTTRTFSDGRPIPMVCRYATPHGILEMSTSTYRFYSSNPEYFNHIAEMMYNEGRSYSSGAGGDIRLITGIPHIAPSHPTPLENAFGRALRNISICDDIHDRAMSMLEDDLIGYTPPAEEGINVTHEYATIQK